MVSETCIQIAGEELVMNGGADSKVEFEEYRVKRFQEIFAASISVEQEMQIDRLMEENAMLKYKLNMTDQERIELNCEISALTNRIQKFEESFLSNRFNDLLFKQQVTNTKDPTQQSCLTNAPPTELSTGLGESNQQQQQQQHEEEEEQLETKNEKLRKQNELLSEQVGVLAKNIELLLIKLSAEKVKEKEANSVIEELRKQVSQKNFLIREFEEVNRTLNSERERINSSRVTSSLNSEQSELFSQQVQAQQKEILQTQIETVERAFQEVSSELQRKYEKAKSKKRGLKSEFSLLKDTIESIRKDSMGKVQFQTEKAESLERTIAKMKSDMLTIRNEWEKKCLSIESAYQAKFAQQRTEFESKLSNIQLNLDGVNVGNVREDREKQLSSQLEQISELKETINKLEKSMKEKEFLIDELRSKIEETSEEKFSLQEQIWQQGQSMNESNELTAKIEVVLSTLQQERDQAVSSVIVLKEQLSAAQVDNNKRLTEAAEQKLSQQMKMLTSRFACEREQLSQKYNNDLNSQIDEMKINQKAHQDQLEKWKESSEKDLIDLRQVTEVKIKELVDQATRLKNSKENIESEKRILESANHKLKLEFDTHKMQSYRVINRLQIQLRNLNNELSEIKGEVLADQTRTRLFHQQQLLQFVDKATEAITQPLRARHLIEIQDMKTTLNAEVEEQQRKSHSQVQQLKTEIERITEQYAQTTKTTLENKQSEISLLQDLLKKSEQLEAERIGQIKQDCMQQGINQVNSVSLEFQLSIDRLTSDIVKQKTVQSQLEAEISQLAGRLEELSERLGKSEVEMSKKESFIDLLQEQLKESFNSNQQIKENHNMELEIVTNKLIEYKNTMASKVEQYRISKENSAFKIKHLQQEIKLLRLHFSEEVVQQNKSDQNKYDEDQAAAAVAQQAATTQGTLLERKTRATSSCHVPHCQTRKNEDEMKSKLYFTQAENKSTEIVSSHGILCKQPTSATLSVAEKVNIRRRMLSQSIIAAQPSREVSASNMVTAQASVINGSAMTALEVRSKQESPKLLSEIEHLLAYSYNLVNKQAGSKSTKASNESKIVFPSRTPSQSVMIEKENNNGFVKISSMIVESNPLNLAETSKHKEFTSKPPTPNRTNTNNQKESMESTKQFSISCHVSSNTTPRQLSFQH